jgi:hypothetical protein
MSKEILAKTKEEVNTSSAISEEIDQWFSIYFQAFIDIGAGRQDPENILAYWGVPLHSSGPSQSKWLKSSEEVVAVLNDMQGILKKVGYTHTVAIDKKITVYNQNAGRVETIMSRRGKDDIEVDRAAVSFELRREIKDWIVISTTANPTKSEVLKDVW